MVDLPGDRRMGLVLGCHPWCGPRGGVSRGRRVVLPSVRLELLLGLTFQ